ncbi:hypothetical protein FG386_002465 [Cryptosporidium ryanae]|uniref:uncharacterized protein n=1 Tax=Cryptosporidium ryanae TaxID=515981 RepID=UPI00351A2389|nr:hypothetical protein FG386_002465 [Cryptosporidium ryanae]
MSDGNITESRKVEILDSKHGGSGVISEDKKVDSRESGCSNWNTRCCCTSRMKFEDVDVSPEDETEEVRDENEASQDLIEDIANVFTGYRRESVFNAISEFEKKLLTLGMAEEESANEESDSEKSDLDSALRRRSEFVQRPLVVSNMGIRRATAPQAMKKEVAARLDIFVNEETTEE